MPYLRRDEFQQRQHMLLDDYEIFHYLDSSELHVSLHFHDFYECNCLLSGEVSYQIESRSYELRPGDVLLIAPNQLHRPLISNSSSAYERIVLWISKAYIEAISSGNTDLSLCFNASHYNLGRFSKAQRTAIEQKLTALFTATREDAFGSDVLRRAKLADLLVELNRDFAATPSSAAHPGISYNRLVGSVCDYLDEHIAEHITLDALSSSVFLSKYYLSRAVREETGITIFGMLAQKRMIRARDLIASGTPLTSAAALCGFSDYSSFYKAFVGEYGVSPRLYASRIV